MWIVIVVFLEMGKFNGCQFIILIKYGPEGTEF